jgi:hypothetical protein
MRVLNGILKSSRCVYFALELQNDFAEEGLVQAVQERDTPRLFEWLLAVLSFQGVSDAAARSYMREHGTPSWEDMERLQSACSCPKLVNYWSFKSCGFVRSLARCNEPAHYARCSVPALPLRNGSLNRMAFSLFLFLRDVCTADLVGWIDRQLARVPSPEASDYPFRLGQALIAPMRSIQGASDKVLNMALSDFLFAVDPARELWRLAGSHMVAIDSLVHNLLHRTGTLADRGADHTYGPTCYRPGKCADIVRQLADEFDARELDRDYPKTFPLLVQHALWNFCAQSGLDICNGVHIRDDRPCDNCRCAVFDICGRVCLRPL